MKQPKKSELISLLDMIGMKMADTIAHWDSGIPAEVRADLLAEIYQPTVRMLIRTGDWPRDRKRSKKAWVRESAA